MPESNIDQRQLPESYPFLLQLLGPAALDPAKGIHRPTLQALERFAFLMRKSPETEVIADLVNAIQQQHLGPGAPESAANQAIVEQFAEAVRESHPDLNFALRARTFTAISLVGESVGEFLCPEYLAQGRPSKDVVAAALQYCSTQTKDMSGNEMRMLAHTQKVLDEAREEGADYEAFRSVLNTVAVQFFETEKNGKPLKRYLNYVNAAITLANMKGQEPSDAETRRLQFYDPFFRLILAQAEKLNVFAQSLEETMTMAFELLATSRTQEYPGDSFKSFLVHQPSELAKLVLKTFNMPQPALINSLCLEPIGGSNQFIGLGNRMPLSEKLEGLNEMLEKVPHDEALRKSAYTNLMAALCTLRVKHPDTVRGTPKRFDEALQDLMPYADIKKAHALAGDENVSPLNDFIMRKHRELIDLVSYVDRGRGFREELGI